MQGYYPPSGAYAYQYGYNQPNYLVPQQPVYNPVPPAYGPSPQVYNPNPPTYINDYAPPSKYNQNPNVNPNIYNENNQKVIVLQPLAIDAALSQSSYTSYNKDVVLNSIMDNFEKDNNAKVYFMSREIDKIFVIEYSLNVILNNKNYKITILIYIPKLYPDDPPEIYVEKKSGVGLSNSYKNGKIDEESFKINIDKFARFDPFKNNIKEIIVAINRVFNGSFPIFKKNDNTSETFGKNNINKSLVNEVLLQTKFFRNDDELLAFIRQQVKDVIRGKYDDFKQKYNVNNNYEELQNINKVVKMQSVNNGDLRNNPMNQKIEELKKISDYLYQKENSLKQELQNMESGKKNIFEKVEDVIRVDDEKYFEYVVKKKVLEDYLIYLKKGYEKKLVDFHDMIDTTRSFSREIFTIGYLMKEKEKEKS